MKNGQIQITLPGVASQEIVFIDESWGQYDTLKHRSTSARLLGTTYAGNLSMRPDPLTALNNRSTIY